MKRLFVLMLGLCVCSLGCRDPYAGEKVETTEKVEKKRENIIGRKTQDIGEFDPNATDIEVSDGKIPQYSPLNPLGPMKAYGPILHKLSKLHIDQAVNLFYAEKGRYPKDHEEFMTLIIKQNNIQLPVLPGNKKYLYDVANHELKVATMKQDR